MKSTFPIRSMRGVNTFSAWLLLVVMLTSPLAQLTATASSRWPIRHSGNETRTSPPEGQTFEQLKVNDPPLVPAAVSVTATLSDDIGLAAKKAPGATITYSAVISAGGVSPADDATGVMFTDILDLNTTLVGGSLNAQPIAKADSYTASGNIPISLAAPGLLANDIDPMTGTNIGLTVTEVQGAGANVGVATNTTAVGRGSVNGSVTVNADGSFTYEPPPGFTGNDTFTYKTSEGVLTDTNMVTITINNMVWFIRNTGGGLNRGTFSNPFTTIATFNTANTGGGATDPKNGDFVSLRSGTYNETDGINLRNTQKLIGEAIQFDTVFTADANSSSAYTTFASVAGAAPSLAATAGNGIDLADSNTVRGLNIGNTPGFFGVNGGAVGSPIINTVNKTGTGGAINVSTSGAFGANVTFATLESSSSPGANINLVGVTGALGITSGGTGLSGSPATAAAINISGGSVSLTYPGNISKSNTNALLNVTGGHTGTLTFNTGTVSANSGTGLQFDNADGSYNFNGTTTLAGGDAGVDILNGSAGSFSFSSGTTITSPTGAAFNVATSPTNPAVTYSGSITQNTSGQRVVNIDGTTGSTITFQTGAITGGANSTGININNANGNVTFSNGMTLGTSGARMTNQAVTITGGSGAKSLGAVSIFTTGAAPGLVSSNTSGTITIASGTINTSGAPAINIDGPAGRTPLAITLATIVAANSATEGINLTDVSGSFTANDPGTAVNISNSTGTGITVNNSTANVNLGNTSVTASGNANGDDTGTGVFLTNNTGGVTFGALTLTPDSGERGLLATDTDAASAAGAITIGSGTITTTNDRAIEITGASAAVRTPLSIVLTAVNANGGTNGIILQSTSGSFTVNGTGTTDGSGGTVTAMTSHGIRMQDVTNITLKNMNVTGNGTAQTVDGATCAADLVTSDNLDCVANIFLQGAATVVLDNLNVQNGGQVGINGNAVSNFSLLNSVVSGNGNESNENGLTFQNLSGTCAITDSLIRDNFAYQVNITNIQSNSSLTLNATGTRTNNAYPTMDSSTTEIGKTAAVATSNQAFLFNTSTTATNLNATINFSGVVFNNTHPGNAVLMNPGAASGTFGGTANNCSFDTTGGGLIIQAQNGMGGTYNITNSEFNRTALQHILYSGLNPFNATLQGTIQGNTIGTAGQSGSACFPTSGANCVGIDVNMIGGSGAIRTKIGGTGGGQPNTIQQFDNVAIRIAGNGTSTPAVHSTIQNNIIQNPLGLVARGIDTNIGISAGANVAGCFTISGNTISGTFQDPGVGTQLGIHTRVRFLSEHRLPGMSGTGTANAQTFLIAQNPGAGGKVFSEGNGVPGYQSGVACTTPLLFRAGGVESAINANSLFASLNRAGLFDFAFPLAPCRVAESKNLLLGIADSQLPVTQDQLDLVVSAAIQRWMATNLKQTQIAAIRELKFSIGDLDTEYLGSADGNRVVIARDAQGKGWFVDATPMNDAEFSERRGATRRYTNPYSQAAGRVDLLTAIEHEIGHRLGLVDSYASVDRDSIMYGYLTIGERRVPASGQAAHSQQGSVSGAHHLKLKNSELKNRKARRHFGNQVSRDIRGLLAPLSGETVTVNGAGSGFTIPAGDSVTITFQATVNTPPGSRSISTQGKVSGGNFTLVNGIGTASPNTNDPETAAVNDATVTNVDTTITWTGATDTNWNTATNWNVPGPVVSTYAPGVSNPGVNDVVIPNVGNQPSITVGDINIFSLNLASGRTLTIDPARTLTINGAAAGSDLTLNGVINGGNLNFAGAGPHIVTNAGGTGSLSSTNIMTVQSPASAALNNNLQAGAVSVNAGATLNITNQTLSLNGAGAALTAAGTFTTTGSTVVFNGSAAQTTGTTYNNLTISNAAGVTLTSNSIVNGTLALTAGDLNTGAFTLTQPNTTASTGIGDVVGTVIRSGGPFALATPLTFGNPNNIITFTGAGTRPTSMTMVLGKAAPATYAAAVQRNYTMSQTGGSGFTATVRLHYLDTELNGNTPETSLGLRRLRTADSHWVAAPPPPGVPTRDGAANWIEATGVLAADLTTQWTFSILVPTASGSTVTGRIVDQSGNPVEGAVVRLEGTQNRKFITDANGIYRFDNVETNGFYTVTPSRANYTFTPSLRSFSQLGETTEAAFGATLVSGGFVNPLDTPEYFVRQHYVDFLGREPDEAGFNFWSDQILECAGDVQCTERRRENVSAAYFLSIEFRKTGGLVDGLYRASYGVAPQYAAFMPDTRTVGLGVQVGKEGWEELLRTNTEAFVNNFVARPEFHQLYDGMDNTLFVDTLISHTGVAFTAAERDALVSGLGTGTMTRAEALRSIAEDSRFVSAKFNQTFVMMEYYGYLRRDYDAGGYAFWLNKLNEFNGNFEQAEMVKAFIVSGEYRNRFPR